MTTSPPKLSKGAENLPDRRQTPGLMTSMEEVIATLVSDEGSITPPRYPAAP